MKIEEQMLQLIRGRGHLMLAGNREYFAGLDYIPAIGFLYFEGDSVANRETLRERIDDTQALDHIRRYYPG